MKFEEMGLSKQLLDALAAMEFTAPTPIQEQAIPLLLKGEDLIGQAQTGTGKTAAFGLPILEAWIKFNGVGPNHVHPDNTHNPLNMRNVHARHGGHEGNEERNAPSIAVPSALILVPTRELAVQVHATLQKMAGGTGAHVVAVYGGVEMRKQLRMFRTPVDVMVGTPGRTLDHMRQGTLNVGKVKTVVLDEADRMLDMGFIRDVVKILERMPSHRQTLLFSATMPKEITQIAHKYMRNPKTIKVSEDRLTVEGVKQYYVRCQNSERMGMLLAAMRTQKPFLSLVFCRMKHEAKRLAQQLRANGFKADAMHGNLNQKQRDRTMEGFRSGRIDVMVATDLASRGIDVPGITHVFNYELPPDPMTYVHRIGRTARAGASGTAISFISGDPRNALWDIEKTTNSKLSELQLTPDKPNPVEKREGHGEQPREGQNARGNREGQGRRGGHSSRFGQGNGEGRREHSGEVRHRGHDFGQHPQVRHAAPHQIQHPQAGHIMPRQTQHVQGVQQQTQHSQASHAAPHQSQHPQVGQQQTQHSQISHAAPHQPQHAQASHAAPHQPQHAQVGLHQPQHSQTDHAAQRQTQHVQGVQQQTQHTQISHAAPRQTQHAQVGQQQTHGREEGGGKKFWERRKEGNEEGGALRPKRGPTHHSSHRKRY